MLKEETLMQRKLAVKRKALSMLQHTQARAVLMMILLVSLTVPLGEVYSEN